MKRLESSRYLIIFAFCLIFLPFNAIAQELELKSALSILEEINKYNNSLGAEISKVPEYQGSIEGKQLIALNRLSDIMKNASSQQIHTLASFLKIGLPAKRAYCTPLQAVLWILEKENDAQVFECSLEQLLDKAWIFTETNRWNDYEVVTDRLNAPRLVNYYQRIRFTYKSKKGSRNAFKGDPHNLFATNIGNCADHAVLTVYCLKKSGYKASVKEVHPSGRGHLACRYKVDGKKHILDNGRPDKFLRRGIIPADQYKMYLDQNYTEKGGSKKHKDPVLSLQDNYGLVLVYLMEKQDRIANMETMCKELGISPFEKKVKKSYMKALEKNGFISEVKPYKKGGRKDFTYTLNEELCERFKKARYSRPENAASKW